MANTKYFGAFLTGLNQPIPTLVEEGYYSGTFLQMYDSFVLTADLAAGDTIQMGGLLPEGARLTACTITTGALGGACTINVGYLAGINGLEPAVPTAFFAALPVSSATVANAHGSVYEGNFYMKVLKDQVQPVIAENAVSSGATGQKIQIVIDYITK